MKFLTTVAVLATAVSAIRKGGNGEGNDTNFNPLNLKANPLPAPQYVQWGEETPIEFFDYTRLDGTHNRVVKDAFKRMMDAVRLLKWYPSVFEGDDDTMALPLPPFPGVVVGKLDGKSGEESGNETDDDQSENEENEKEKRGWFDKISKVSIEIEDEDAELYNADESYTMDIERQVNIKSKTVWGALHALATLQQLILYDDHKFFIERPVKIEDEPNYNHRGIMIDTSRNYLSVPKIKKQIDMMALSKLNVLHWHLVDSQSWPVEIPTYPQMTKDAYSSRMTYSSKDIKGIVQYAKARGVRVYAELDLPGHSASGWRQVNEESVIWSNSWMGQLDPTVDETYEMVKNVYNDVAEMFEDPIFHVGHDEVQTGNWNASESIRKWLAEDESRDFSDVLQVWVDKTEPIFRDRKDRKLIMWEDVVLSNLTATIPKDIILQVWNEGLTNIKRATSLGHDIIVSSKEFWYLNCGRGDFINNDPRVNIQRPEQDPTNFNYDGGNAGSPCGPKKPFDRQYTYDFTDGLTDEEASHILGAEVAVWSELIDDANIDTLLWPYSSAFSERMWSGNRDSKGMKRTFYLTQRLQNFRDYMVAMNVNADSIGPRYCFIHPHSCDLYKLPSLIQQIEDLNATFPTKLL